MVREGHEQKTSGNSAARGNKLGTVRRDHWFPCMFLSTTSQVSFFHVVQYRPGFTVPDL